jgi:predicted site-specific integrase-resolvase
MTPEEVAKILQVSTRTLEKWRHLKSGPSYLKLNTRSGSIRYPEDKLDDWIGGQL